ncbi:MAG: aromatic acid decarboxylase [Thermoleophilia bacterium]|nr:aromatic acid decarboxylase [Thermoleophilia bacterium]MCZ4495609.1 aromatic acid decarboxylase [Thermoleophilia bacterium]
MDVFVGITGASGAPYARRLVQALVAGGHTVGAAFSSAAPQVTGQELYGDLRMPRDEVIERWLADTGLPADRLFEAHDFGSPYASGSARWDAAVICPCSMDTLATLASGAGSNLLHRAASVALKEDRKLILVPRETPLSTIHLENLLRIRRAGAHVLPAMPAFYQLPESIEDMIDFVVAKVLNLLGLEQSLLGEWDAGITPS